MKWYHNDATFFLFLLLLWPSQRCELGEIAFSIRGGGSMCFLRRHIEKRNKWAKAVSLLGIAFTFVPPLYFGTIYLLKSPIFVLYLLYFSRISSHACIKCQWSPQKENTVSLKIKWIILIQNIEHSGKVLVKLGIFQSVCSLI